MRVCIVRSFQHHYSNKCIGIDPERKAYRHNTLPCLEHGLLQPKLPGLSVRIDGANPAVLLGKH